MRTHKDYKEFLAGEHNEEVLVQLQKEKWILLLQILSETNPSP